MFSKIDKGGYNAKNSRKSGKKYDKECIKSGEP